MPGMQLELDEELMALLRRLEQPVERVARELMVMELYRRELVSSGKAAELLGMSKPEFIQHASDLGIPYFRVSAAEVKADADRIRDATAKA